MELEYKEAIEDIVKERLKGHNALIDTEKMASHMSVYTTSMQEKTSGANKSGTTSGKSSKVKKTSKSNVKESTSKSKMSDMSSTSMS